MAGVAISVAESYDGDAISSPSLCHFSLFSDGKGEFNYAVTIRIMISQICCSSGL